MCHSYVLRVNDAVHIAKATALATGASRGLKMLIIVALRAKRRSSAAEQPPSAQARSWTLQA